MNGRNGSGLQLPVSMYSEAWYPQQQAASKNPKASNI